MAADILIVDDETDIRELISGILEDEGYETRLAHDSDSALDAIRERRPSLVVLDIWLQGSKLDGLDLLNVVREGHPGLPVVIISGHGNIETAVSAIRRGAYDYIEKPFKADRLLLVIARALEATRLRRENEQLRGRSDTGIELVGAAPALRQLASTLKKIAPSNGRVMVSGPLGSGKELAARALHAWSSRADGPFVILPAATMALERLQEELFGVESADGSHLRTGALEEAHGGTLYVDEVADMPLETQGQVLRVLVEQKFLRVNGRDKVSVDVRVVSSTSRNLEELIKLGQFREDLYHRLSVVPLPVPALADRREDIPLLVEHFTRQYSKNSGQPVREFAEDALAMLQTQPWPGNIRQLRNSVERLLIMASGEGSEAISASMIPPDVGADLSDDSQANGSEMMMTMPLRDAREMFERTYLSAQLARFDGNISKTATFVGMERSALHRKIKSLALRPAGQDEAP